MHSKEHYSLWPNRSQDEGALFILHGSLACKFWYFIRISSLANNQTSQNYYVRTEKNKLYSNLSCKTQQNNILGKLQTSRWKVNRIFLHSHEQCHWIKARVEQNTKCMKLFIQPHSDTVVGMQYDVMLVISTDKHQPLMIPWVFLLLKVSKMTEF